MRVRVRLSFIVVALALCRVASVASAANAPCSSLTNPIYGIGGSSSLLYLGKLGGALAALPSPNTMTIVYQSPAACNGINTILNNTLLTGTATYFDATGTAQTCDLPAGGQAADFGNMLNSAALCPGTPATLPNTIADQLGPINTVNLIVPVASSQLTISAAAAYFVFGFGMAGQAAPWILNTEISIRSSTSAVQQLLAEAINVPASAFAYGTNGGSQNGVITQVANSQNPENAIGFISGDAADANRATVRTLAYQHYGQTCAYLPDSSLTAHDKKNIRDGHYFLWTPQHFFAVQDGTTGVITSPNARTLFGYLNGLIALPTGLDLIAVAIAASLVPDCAMHVRRDSDLGLLHTYTPAKSCGGYFDSLTGGTTQTACPNGPSDCPTSAPACNFGYCEVQ